MPRIQPVQKDQADAKTAVLLESVGKKLGMVPNLISTMAHSLAVANAYLGFSQSLAGGLLPARLREQIALVVGETNGCGYCVAAHTALGKGAGLSEAETCNARRTIASDPKEQVALVFARKLVVEPVDIPVASFRIVEGILNLSLWQVFSFSTFCFAKKYGLRCF